MNIHDRIFINKLVLKLFKISIIAKEEFFYAFNSFKQSDLHQVSAVEKSAEFRFFVYPYFHESLAITAI